MIPWVMGLEFGTNRGSVPIWKIGRQVRIGKTVPQRPPHFDHENDRFHR